MGVVSEYSLARIVRRYRCARIAANGVLDIDYIGKHRGKE
jgi:hypothetical protein